jgi:hypothetical protein
MSNRENVLNYLTDLVNRAKEIRNEQESNRREKSNRTSQKNGGIEAKTGQSAAKGKSSNAAVGKKDNLKSLTKKFKDLKKGVSERKNVSSNKTNKAKQESRPSANEVANEVKTPQREVTTPQNEVANTSQTPQTPQREVSNTSATPQREVPMTSDEVAAPQREVVNEVTTPQQTPQTPQNEVVDTSGEEIDIEDLLRELEDEVATPQNEVTNTSATPQMAEGDVADTSAQEIDIEDFLNDGVTDADINYGERKASKAEEKILNEISEQTEKDVVEEIKESMPSTADKTLKQNRPILGLKFMPLSLLDNMNYARMFLRAYNISSSSNPIATAKKIWQQAFVENSQLNKAHLNKWLSHQKDIQDAFDSGYYETAIKDKSLSVEEVKEILLSAEIDFGSRAELSKLIGDDATAPNNSEQRTIVENNIFLALPSAFYKGILRIFDSIANRVRSDNESRWLHLQQLANGSLSDVVRERVFMKDYKMNSIHKDLEYIALDLKRAIDDE